MVINRYSATRPLLSPVAAAKNSVLASATAIAASTAKFATTGHVSAVRPDLSAPSAVAARCTIEYIREPISRLRCAAARVTVMRSPGAESRGGVSLPRSGSVLLAQRREVAIGARHRRWATRAAMVGVVGRVVGHAGVLVGRSVAGPTARVGGHPARIITPPSRHKSILSYAARQPGVARQPSMETHCREGTA